MPGHLFTQYFLTDGIRQTPERRAQASAFQDFREAARRLFHDFAANHNPNEHHTEQDLIRPLLQLLGWTDDLPQPTAPGGEDRPDLLLFPDAQAKTRAGASQATPYLEGLAVAELKSFRTPLDTRGQGKGIQASSPHAQILRYLATADSVTDGHLRWGILTNGAVWRLYDQKTRPRATAYYEVDLEALFDNVDQDALRTFHLLFRRAAFLRRPGADATFVETALAEGKRYEQRVAQSLAGVVFQRVFPRLLQALADAADRPMPQIREAALIFLYRLLFVLYAEDRGLLPVNDAAYDDYGLRKRVRDDVAQRKARHDTFSGVASSYYDHLGTLFRLIDLGDQSIGLPPYNGGLFAHNAAPLLNQVRLPDAVIADVVHDLSHTQADGQPGYVNYRDMSVQQLGSIYERLLEQEPVLDDDGQVHVRPNPYARKDSGSFYTPQDLVDLIVDQTLKPLVEERLQAFEARSEQLQSDRRPRSERRAELSRLDPAEAVLDLKVLDPAMGSGHFLVSAVDFLTDYIADLVEFAPAVPGWLPEDDPYHSPLLDRVAAIRADILKRAAQSGWAVNQSQLTDQAIIRRLVLKRCIYGVDKNPLTVELAKVSLWLHSFTVGAPLSFLDHHLRCGDSLIGLRIADAKAELQRLNVPMFVESALQGVENAAHGMRQIEQLSDADVTEVHQSETLFHAVESATSDLRGFLDTLAGLRWHTAGLKVRQRAQFESPLTQTLAANPTHAFHLLADAVSSPLQGERQIRPSSAEIGEGSSGRGLTHQQPPADAHAPGPHPSSPRLGERQIRAYSAEIGEGSSAHPTPSTPTVRGEPPRSPSEGRVEPPTPATTHAPPSSPSNVGAASVTRPSSGRNLTHQQPLADAHAAGPDGSSPRQGERQIRASSPEIGEQSSAHPTSPQEAASSSLSLEGEGWGEGGSQPQHASRAHSNPSHESRLSSPRPEEEGQREGSSAHPTPPTPTVRGEPPRSPSEGGVEPHSLATTHAPPSSPSNVGAASVTRPSSARARTHQHPPADVHAAGLDESSARQAERQIRPSSAEIGEQSSAHPTPPQEAASSSLSLEGEGWGEGGSQPQHPSRAHSNPSHESRLSAPRPEEEGQREGSSAHPTPPQEAASSSLSLEGEGWGEGGSQPQQPTQGAPDPAFTTLLQKTKSTAKQESFLHWEAAFPGVWRHWQNQTPQGGFDAVIGNPPWDRIKLQEVEWFATRDPDLARAPTAAARRQGIKRLRDQGDALAQDFDNAKARADQLGKVVRASGHYPLLGGGDINLYSLFVERSLRLVKPNGLVGLLTPSGIYADRTAARFFQSVSTTGRVAAIYDFENRRLGTDLPPFFPDIDSRFKFCALIVGGPERTFPETHCGFFLPGADAIQDPDRAFTLSPDDFARVNPNTGTAPVFRTRRDADLTRRIYRHHPVLVDRSGDEERKAWPIQHLRQFDVTNDSHLFRTAAQLESEGFYPVQSNRWKRGKELYLPLYEGKMANSFDHRTASVVVNPHNLMRPGQPQESTLDELMDPTFMPRPAFWVSAEEVSDTFPEGMGWTLVYRRITAPTNARTTLATILPWCGVSYTIPMLRARGRKLSALDASCLQSVLASFCFDYVSRQKLQGTSMSLTSLEQLPVIARDAYNRPFGDRTAADLVQDHVLRLTYTSHDMAPFARDLNHHGPPFPWDPQERRHLRARLDALYFHLYGLSRDDAAYILSTFPIIQRQDQPPSATTAPKP